MRTTWGYYPLPDEAYYRYILDKSVISMTYGINRDLKKLDKETIKAEYMTLHPGLRESQVRPLYSMLYHFAHTLKIGDRIVYPSTRYDRRIHVGNCKGGYRHVPDHPLNCIHQRDVEWVETFDRNVFSPDALRGIQVTLALFHIHDETFLRELALLMG